MSRAHPLSPVTAVALALIAFAAPSPSRAQTAAEIASTAQRLSQEVPCVRAQQERLGSTLRLLEEAERQARSTTSGEAARRDAVHSAEALELRLGIIVGELRACLGPDGTRVWVAWSIASSRRAPARRFSSIADTTSTPLRLA